MIRIQFVILSSLVFSMVFGALGAELTDQRPATDLSLTSPWSRVLLPRRSRNNRPSSPVNKVRKVKENNTEPVSSLKVADDSATVFEWKRSTAKVRKTEVPGNAEKPVTARVRNPEEKFIKIPLPSFRERMACELRIVNIASGKVLKQVSGMAFYDERKLLARSLLDELLDGIGGDKVVVVSLCNRRQTEVGLKVTTGWTRSIVNDLRKKPHFKRVVYMDLRASVENEEDLENNTTLLSNKYRETFGEASHVIVGGVAISRKSTTTID